MAELPDPERWQRVREVFGGALERDPEAWAPYLRRACGDDRELRTEVESLLEAHRAGGDFLAEPAHAESAIGDATSESSADAGPAPAEGDPVEGRRLGAYRVERCIGRGGMGAVYSAVRADESFDLRVAIKLLQRDRNSADVVRRFHAERQILAGLEHPNVARLLDGGTTGDGRPYLVMEYVEGLAIDDYCDRHRLRIAERLALFRTVCAAVQFAHRNLVVHRDLKPSNILVTAGGEPKLLDFGIAKILEPEGSRRTLAPTETMLRMMTPDYASPEQVLGTPVTTASDVYALGVLLFSLLTGRHPFALKSRSQIEVLWAIQHRDPEPPSSAVGLERPPEAGGADPDGETPSARSLAALRRSDPGRLRRRLAGDLDNIVLMALRKEPERRYASVDLLSEDLRRHLEGHPVLARGDSFSYRTGKFVRRHRLAVAAAALLFAAIVGFGILMAIQRSQIARERDLLAEQRSATETERRRAEELTAFLVDLFEVSDPFGDAPDADSVSARELLDKGAERLSTLDGQPEVGADFRHTIGAIYRRLGLLDAAAPLLESALATRRQYLDADHPKVAESLAEEGLLRQDLGDYPAARELLGEALAMRRRHYGEHHRATADSLGHLAALAWTLGDFDDAARLRRQALAVYRQQLGPESAAVADSLHWLALILQSQGESDGAEKAYSETLAIQRRLLGDGHVKVAATRANLAQLYLRRGDAERAEPLYRQALETFRHRLGEDHVQVALCLRSLAAAEAARGELPAAEQHYREALALLRRLRGPDHPDLAATLDGLAGARLAAGDHAEAERAYARALEIRRQALGEGNPYLVISLTGLARVATEKGDYAAAERRLDEALAIGRRAFPGGHWRLDVARSVLGDCRARAGRHREAEPLLAGSYRALLSSQGERSASTRRALDRLIRLYEAWGRPEEAARLRQELG